MKRILVFFFGAFLIQGCNEVSSWVGDSDAALVDSLDGTTYEEGYDLSEESAGDPCPDCQGSGEQTCTDCDGAGRKHCGNCDGTGWDAQGRSCLNCEGSGIVGCSTSESCRMCAGAGYGYYETCPHCDGSGSLVLENGNTITCGGEGLISVIFMMTDYRSALGGAGQSYCGGSGKVFRPNSE